jgi:predicted phage tail component-like protein
VSYDYDFIGFTYNGKHSVRDLKIYRTSNSNRYEEGITPTLKETTASVDGQVGQYYFGTKVEQKVFNISFAFDNLTDGDIREIKKTFSGDGIHDLIFDENPYKAYSAKVTGSATMKHLAFEQNGRRVYKGEGNIQLTCYYPYARSLAYTTTSGTSDEKAIEVQYGFASGKPYVAKQPKELKCGIIIDGSIETTFYIPAIGGTPLVNLIWITYINESGKR